MDESIEKLTNRTENKKIKIQTRSRLLDRYL
jgi:hypothetical protein